MKTASTYCLTVSLGEKSRHSVTGFFAQGLTWLQPKYWLRLHSDLVLRVLFQAHSGSWQNSVSCSWRTKVPWGMLSSSIGNLQILATWHCNNMAGSSSKLVGEISLQSITTGSYTAQSNQKSESPSYSQVLSTFQVRESWRLCTPTGRYLGHS